MPSIFTSSTEIGSWCGGGEEAHNELNSASLATFRVGASDVVTPISDIAADFTYQDMFVTSISESFSEGESRHDVIVDTYASFATGANPIKINISGFLVRTPSIDSRVSFLNAYEKYLRGTAVEYGTLHLDFLLKQSCFFKFSLHDASIVDDVTYPDLTKVSMNGIAYAYSVTPAIT